MIGRRNLVLALAVALLFAATVGTVASPVAGASVPAGRSARPATPLATARRYIALGDGVAYGYGLANPATTRHSGLAPDQPPSKLAYPSVLAHALGLSLNVRKTGCTLTGDQLAVAGAASVAANVNGPDSICRSSHPHKTVDPNELAHLGTAHASLITLQVGWDDVDFSGCLMRDLKIYVPYALSGGTTKKCTSGNGLTGGEANRVNDMRIALGAILTIIRRKQPDATVVVLNYYQPVPSPSQFVNIDKSEVCAHLAVPSRLQTAYTHAVIVQNALNRAIATEMEQHTHDHLVNLAGGSVFEGHGMCTRNPYLFTGGPKVGLWRFAYPNRQGQAAIAKAIRAQVKGLK